MSGTTVFAAAHGTDSPFAVLKTTKRASKKRERSEGGEGSGSEEEFVGFSRGTSVASSFTSLSADQLAQYRASGLEPGDDIPQFPFPHRSTSPRRNVKLAVQNELNELTPRLVQAESADQSRAPGAKKHDILREQHLAVLTAVLHRTLLERDWQRAGRAWGLLLRSGHMSRDLRNRTGQKAMDVRTNGRWGIGAEILLRGATEEPKTSPDEDQMENISDGNSSMYSADDTSSNSPSEAIPTIGGVPITQIESPKFPDAYINDFSEVGFQNARRYYERLIVQFPPHHRGQGPRASTFYAAMFSLWIYSVVEKSKQAQFKLVAPPAPHNTREWGEHKARLNWEPDLNIDPSLVRPIKQEELRGAREVADRLDDVLLGPPYDGDAELLQMRGFVAMWIADLGEERYRKGEREKAKTLFEKARGTGQELEKEVEELLEDEEWVNAVDSVEQEDERPQRLDRRGGPTLGRREVGASELAFRPYSRRPARALPEGLATSSSEEA